MKKTFLIVSILIVTLSLSGCTNKKDSTQEPNRTFSSNSASSELNIDLPIILTEETFSYSPYYVNEENVIFPNRNDNSKISILPASFTGKIITTNDIIDFISHSTESLTVINNMIYFADGNNKNCLSSINLTDKTYTKINSNNVHKLISNTQDLFYINSNDKNKLYKYNIENNISTSLTFDSVGEYLINGDYILFQNLSDSSSLYSMKTDGSQRTKLTDFSVDSFVPHNNEILAINSSDNNNLYLISPNNSETKRIALMNGSKLKTSDGKLYFINIDNANFLYELNVVSDTYEVSSKLIYKDGLNDYFPTKDKIFIEKMPNVNNTYILPLSSN